MSSNIIDERLTCGARVLLVPSQANQIVALCAFLPIPGAIERADEAGLVGITLRMLLRGTKRRTADELAFAIESLGTSISFEVFQDFSLGSMVCTDDALEPSLNIFFEVLQEPSFEPAEFEKERQSTLAAIREQMDDKLAVTQRAFLRALYGEHSYGFSRLGELETVKEFRAEQAVALYGNFVDPSAALYVCVGNFDPDRVRELLNAVVIARPTAPMEGVIPEPLYVRNKTIHIDREFEQSFLIVGFPACPISSEDWVALRVLNSVLGEGMSSRLFVKLREGMGLAYATGSFVSFHVRGGHLAGYIGTKHESVELARDLMLEEFSRIREERVPEEELERAKNYVVGKNLIDHQRNARRAFYLGYWETVGRGYAMDELYPEFIRKVGTDELHRVARKYLVEPTIVSVGQRIVQ
ncbi:MAG: insulinase family protein [Candidatus Sumerlaea chitinivorans]|nr:insulinase family protein [Candidatus Sumerlaea chitinivorans]